MISQQNLSSNHLVKDATYAIGVIFIMCISPLLSLPFIFNGIRHRKREAFFLLALFLGLFAFLSIPMQDCYRHTLTYYGFKGATYSNINYATFMLHGLIAYIDVFLVNNGISFQYYRLFAIMLGFLELTSIFNYKIENSEREYTQSEIMYRFLILFFFFDILYTIQGTRYGFALCHFVYALFLFVDKKKMVWGTIFTLIAMGFHLSFIMIAPLIFILYALKINSPRKAILLSFILFGIIGFGLDYIGPALLGDRYNWYFKEGGGIHTQYTAMTTAGLIIYLLMKCTSIPFIRITLSCRRNTKWHQIALAVLCLCIIFFSNAVLTTRLFWLFNYVAFYLYLELDSQKLVNDTIKKTLLICAISFQILSIPDYKRMILYSGYHRLAFPITSVLSVEYDEAWLFNNMSEEGSYISK